MNSAADIWSAVLHILEQNLTPTSISTWFADCEAVDIKDNHFILYTPSEFKRNILSSRYASSICEALSEIFSSDFELTILSENELEEYRGSSTKTAPASPFDGSHFTFERFVVGSSNKFAHAAAMAVANNPASAYNPLFLYGNSGLGKTHLLYSIGHSIKTSNPGFKIVYVKGDDFTNELINAIQNATTPDFRAKYRTADLLLVDDIQFISGKDMTQEEFFHTFNTLYEAFKQIVLTSDRPPMEMLRLEDRLKSRFEWGLLADIQPPDYETRVAIVKNKALSLGVVLPDKISFYIAENITSNIRQMEGTVKKIAAYRDLLNNATVNMDLVAQITKDIIRSERECPPSLIVEKTAAYYSLTAAEVLGKSRSKNTALARQISMYLMRKLTDNSLNDVSKFFGKKDHSTVIHAIRKIESMLASSPEFSDIMRDITSNITNHD